MKAAIVGVGTLGVGWAISFARAGWTVLLYDPDPSACEKGLRIVGERLPALERHALVEDAEAVRDRLVAAGLDPTRIEIRPTGDDDHVALCSTSLCRAENRNAQVFINDLRDREPRRSSIQRPQGSKTSMAPSDEPGVSDEMPQ